VADHLARQIGGQRLLRPPDLAIGRRQSGGPGRHVRRRLGRRHALLQIAQDQLELCDLAFQFLRRGAEACALQDGELMLELLDLQLPGPQLGLQRRGEGPQGFRFDRDLGRRERHAQA